MTRSFALVAISFLLVFAIVILSPASTRGENLGPLDTMLFILMTTGTSFERDSAGGPQWDDTIIEAIKSGNLAQVQRLLDKGKGPNARHRAGGSALRWAAVYGHRDIVILLLDKGAKVNAEKGGFLEEEFIRSVIRGETEKASDLLRRGADVNAKAEVSETALHWACVMGHSDLVRLLLDKGADINAMSGSYCTPLALAALQGHEEVVRLLLDNRADVNMRAEARLIASLKAHSSVLRLLETRTSAPKPLAKVPQRSQEAPELKWKIRVGDFFSSPIVVSHGHVFFFPPNSNLLAVDAEKGREKWKAPNSWGPDFTEGKGLLIFREGQTLYAVDIKTRQVKWKQDEWTSGRILAADGMIVTETADGYICGLDLGTGAVRWKFVTGHRLDRPTAAGGMAFTVASENIIYGIDIKTGRNKWEYKPKGTAKSFITVSHGVIYFGSWEGDTFFCRAVDIKTKQEKWKVSCGEISAAPGIGEKVVCFPSSDGLYGVEETTGKFLWRLKTEGLSSTPVIADGRAYFRDRETFYALDLKSGEVKRSLRLGLASSVDYDVAIADGIVYFGGNDGCLYAVDTKSAERKGARQ